MVWGEQEGGDVLDLRGGDGVNLGEEVVDDALTAVVEVVAGEVEGILFAVVTGDGYLTFELSLGGSELTGGEGVLHRLV